MLKVDGRLIRTKINGGYKYEVVDGTRYFKELEDAFKYCNKVYGITKIQLGIRKGRLTKESK